MVSYYSGCCLCCLTILAAAVVFVFTLFIAVPYVFLNGFVIDKTFIALPEHLRTWGVKLTLMIILAISFSLIFAVRSLQSVSDDDNSFIIANHIGTTTQQLSGYSMVVETIHKW
jgi:hypothetical protein